MFTNASKVTLNATSNYGSCKVLSDSTLLSQKCQNVSLESLQYGINRFILLHSADGQYAINIYRGGNIVSITAEAKGKKSVNLHPEYFDRYSSVREYSAILDPSSTFVTISVKCITLCSNLKIYSEYSPSPHTQYHRPNAQ